MKKFIKYGVFLTVCAVALSSCNCYKKMARNVDGVSIVANPEILTLRGNDVVTDVTVVFPERFYNPKAIVRVTPMLVFDGGVIEGQAKYLQGERVRDNYPVISRANGGMYTQSVSIPWDERARVSTLEMKVEARCDKRNSEFSLLAVVPIAKGVNTLQQDLDFASAMILMPDNFKRVTHESEAAQIMYLINRAEVRSGELSREDIQAFEAFVKENAKKDRVTMGNIQAKGFASPDGPEAFNDQLSKKRSESGQTAIGQNLKGVDVKYDVAAYGEDWDGFRKLVENSNIADRNLIISVLNMYSSSAQREAEIRNLSNVYESLKNDILPQLRRTQFLATIDIQGKTDAELRDAVMKSLNSLNVEEMLFAATLFEDNATKIKIYDAAASKFNDARAFNNLGIAYAGEGQFDKAQAAIEKATRLSSDPALSNNLAVVALAKGDFATANKHLSSASNQAKGIAAVTEGNYAKAASLLTGYNRAVAEVLNGNLSAAKQSLSGNNSADAEYLRAVIASKEGNRNAAVSSLRSAISKDSSLKAKALKDVHFRDMITASDLN